MYVSIYVTADYVATELGSTCIEIGKIPIFDKYECEKAASYLGKRFNSMSRLTYENDLNYPTGCYFLRSGSTYWNSHPNGLRRFGTAMICNNIVGKF